MVEAKIFLSGFINGNSAILFSLCRLLHSEYIFLNPFFLHQIRFGSDLEYDKNSGELFYSIPEYDCKIPVCTIGDGKSRDWYMSLNYIDYAAGPQLTKGLEFNFIGVIIGKELG